MGIFNAAPLRPVADDERSTQVLTAGSAEEMKEKPNSPSSAASAVNGSHGAALVPDDERRLTGGEVSGTLKMPCRVV